MSNDSLKSQNSYLKNLLDKAASSSAERDIAENIQSVLTEELHHRMTNMLAVVTAIVRQSIRVADSLESAERAITFRLRSMATAHEILLKSDWKSAHLRSVIAATIEQHNAIAGRIVLEGEDLDIVSSAVVPMALMLNELCTNATKYGALSGASGHVKVHWIKDAVSQSLKFRWIEQEGPLVLPPERRSFGMRLIEEAIPRQFGGRGHLSFPSSGAQFEFDVPTNNFLAQGA